MRSFPELALVDLHQFRIVQDMHDRAVETYANAKHSPRQRLKYVLSRRVMCHDCGHPSMYLHGSWRCENHLKQWACSNSYGFRPNVLEHRVLDGLTDILGSSFESTYRSILEDAFENETATVEAERTRLARELDVAQKEYDRGLEANFTDGRLAGDMQAKLRARAERIDELRSRLIVLPPRRAMATLEEVRVATLADEMSALRLRVPLTPESGDGDVIRVLQRLVLQVRPRQLEGGMLEVEIDYALGAVFGVDLPPVTKRFVCSATEGCQTLRTRRRRAAGELASTISDEEYEVLRRLPHVVKFLDVGEWLRPVLDFLVTCLTTETTVQHASRHFRIPASIDGYEMNWFRRSPAACDEFEAAMRRLRPSCVHDLNRLNVAPRSSRTLRSRLEKVEHPFMDLSFCMVREEVGGYGLTPEEWKTTWDRLQASEFGDRLGHKRKLRIDIGHLFRTVAEGKLYDDVPGLIAPGAFRKRWHAAFKNGLFTEITRLLLILDGNEARAGLPIPDVKVPKDRKSREPGLGKASDLVDEFE